MQFKSNDSLKPENLAKKKLAVSFYISGSASHIQTFIDATDNFKNIITKIFGSLIKVCVCLFSHIV